MTKRFFTNSSWPGASWANGTKPLDSDTMPITAGDPLPSDPPTYINYCVEARQRIQQLEDALLAVVKRLAALERQLASSKEVS